MTPYGEAWRHHAAPAEQADMPGFSGHIEDSPTGLAYMQARYYDTVKLSPPYGIPRALAAHFRALV